MSGAAGERWHVDNVFPDIPGWLDRRVSKTEREIAWLDYLEAHPEPPPLLPPRERDWRTIAKTPTEADLIARDELLRAQDARAARKQATDEVRHQALREQAAKEKEEQTQIKQAAQTAKGKFKRGLLRAR